MQLGTNSPSGTLRMSQVIAALSNALDMTEGQPRGHSARACMIGMRLAREIRLPSELCPALFYALLLKDLGCSTNSSKVCYLFGANDQTAKRNLKTVDWTSRVRSLGYVARNVLPDGSALQRARRFLSVVLQGPAKSKELVQMRCDRGASIARSLLLPEQTALAIHALDEHWDGSGYPDHLAGEQIPLLARILNLAQTVEVFWTLHDVDAARDLAMARMGSWFDPELVKAILPVFNDEEFWNHLEGDDAAALVSAFEPEEHILSADDQTLDRVARGFGEVIDAKSPWTFCHSAGVAEVAVGIGKILGFSGELLKQLNRAALLHDIGKLGISNQVLEKPGKLTPEEFAQIKMHPQLTYEILSRVDGFYKFCDLAASHHERLDGRGYHRGLGGEHLSLPVRTLVVADMYEALAARRPYRHELSEAEVMTILQKEAGTGICPQVLAALKAFVAAGHFVPYCVAA